MFIVFLEHVLHMSLVCIQVPCGVPGLAPIAVVQLDRALCDVILQYCFRFGMGTGVCFVNVALRCKQ